MSNKVESIKNLMAPKTVKQVRSFLGMVNYFKDMWRHRSHLLAPLTDLTSNKDGTVRKKRGPIKWEKVHQEAFDKIKQAITDNVMLSFPDFNKPFEIHTDSSDIQLGSVIMQDHKPVAFYSRKLNPAQRNYTTGKREMLSIVETLRAYRNILLGHKIIICMDHQNLVNDRTRSGSTPPCLLLPQFHIVLATGCSTHQNWQSLVLLYLLVHSGQTDDVTRIASGSWGGQPKKEKPYQYFQQP
jgi:hypothetical protein